jgi:hypothetical protein
MRRLIAGFLLLGFCACKQPVEANAVRAASPEISPTDFVLLPCGGIDSVAGAPCVLIRAGGKRVLAGAPLGVSRNLSAEDLRQLDAVLLFSLNAADIEGLGELRSATLAAGRDYPLPVSGPEGTSFMLRALNAAYTISDRKTLGALPEIASLQPVNGEADTKTQVFNTGDLVISHLINTDGLAGYWVEYEGARAILEPCGMSQARQFGGVAAATLACEKAEGLSDTWPLKKPLYIKAMARSKAKAGL